jgi:flavodoxin
MNACVVYFSRTGNTKRLAQAIADVAKAAIYDLGSIVQSTIQTCDPLVLGTPVEGSCPAKETMAFIDSLPKVEGKKAILFCTFRIFGNKRTMNAMEKALAAKGYETVLKVSKKGLKPEKEADFSDILSEVRKGLEKLSP